MLANDDKPTQNAQQATRGHITLCFRVSFGYTQPYHLGVEGEAEKAAAHRGEAFARKNAHVL